MRQTTELPPGSFSPARAVMELDYAPSFQEADAAAQPEASCTPARRNRESRVRDMVEEHFDRVWRFLRRLGLPEDAADDASQQVFAIAARKLDVILEGGELRYLIGIAVRVAAESKRMFARQQEIVARNAPSPCESADTPLPDELLDQKRAREVLDGVISGMPMDVRAVFIAFEMEGMSAPEIADMFDVPLGTVASRLRRGREHLRAAAERIQNARRRP